MNRRAGAAVPRRPAARLIAWRHWSSNSPAWTTESVRTLAHPGAGRIGDASLRRCRALSRAGPAAGAPADDSRSPVIEHRSGLRNRLDAGAGGAARRWPRNSRTWRTVPLGALLADLREFDEADEVYRDALRGYRDVSPFAMAWVCFQLGVLWGERYPERQSARATMWYRKAIAYLPCLCESPRASGRDLSRLGRYGDAEALLLPAISSDDPEVFWRLGDVSVASGRDKDANRQIESHGWLREPVGQAPARLRGPARRFMPEAATIPRRPSSSPGSTRQIDRHRGPLSWRARPPLASPVRKPYR